MVSEQSSLRSASTESTMTHECFYVRVGKERKKEARDSISMVSDLRNFINQRFNFPRPQVALGEDGCVIITGIFDGIPDDIENQDHEAFDHILKLVGWIEGQVELPICSDSAAPKDFEVTLANSERIYVEEVPNSIVLDKSHHCDVMNDDLLIEDELKIEDALIIDEEIVQMELMHKRIMMKESSDLDAYHVLEEMPKSTNNTETKSFKQKWLNQTESCTLLAPLIGVSFDPGGKLKVIWDETNVAREFSNLVARQVFDKMPQSANTNEIEHINELLKGDGEQTIANKVLNENLRCDRVKDDNRLTEEMMKIDDALNQGEEIVQMELKDEMMVTEKLSNLVAHRVLNEMPKLLADELDFEGLLRNSLIKDATPLLLISEFTDLIKVLNAFPAQGDIPTDYIGILCFDPGGELNYVGDSLKLKLVLPRNSNLSFTNEELTEMINLPRAAIFGCVGNQSALLASECELASTQVVKDSCLAMLILDLEGVEFASLNGEFVYPKRNGNLWCIVEELSEVRNLFGASPFGITVIKSGLLALEFVQDKVISIFQPWELDSNQVIEVSVAMLIFDPGGQVLIHLIMFGFTVAIVDVWNATSKSKLELENISYPRSGLHGDRALFCDPRGDEFLSCDLDLSKYEKLSKLLLYQLGSIAKFTAATSRALIGNMIDICLVTNACVEMPLLKLNLLIEVSYL